MSRPVPSPRAVLARIAESGRGHPNAEEWRPVISHPTTYEVSNYGRVRSIGRAVAAPALRAGSRWVPGTLIRFSPRRGGNAGNYLRVMLQTPTKRHAYVHMLVCEAFHGPRPADRFACHRDDDADNNTAANLYWGTRAENDRDRYGPLVPAGVDLGEEYFL